MIAYAKRFPDGVFSSKSPVPYTFASSVTLQEVFRLTYGLILRLEDHGVTAVPIPSEPYEHWDEEKREGRGLMSLKHIGYLAGLGMMGRNTLLTNNQYGNLVTLGAVLVDIPLKEDPIAEYSFCGDGCEICLDNCPAGAIDGKTVNQKKCRECSQMVTKKGYFLYTCNLWDEQRRLFEPLPGSKHLGSGLGLAIVFQIVRQHRGDITVRSASDRGARFDVRLPLVPRPLAT